MMKIFSMPADFKKETIDKYDILNQCQDGSIIQSTYGNISLNNRFGSGRDIKRIPEVDFQQLSSYIEYSRKKKIDFFYTLNASYMHNTEFTEKGIRDLDSFLTDLRAIKVKTLIVSLPSLIEVIQGLGHEFRIKASVICQITNPNKAVLLKKMGVHSIVVDESINRDFKTLARIREVFGNEVEIIVNSICHQDCQYRIFHYNQLSGDSIDRVNEISCEYYRKRCALRLFNEPSNFLRLTWIRPDDIGRYTDIGINRFKLQGRQAVLTGDPVRTVSHYMNQFYDGDLLELLFMFSSQFNFPISFDNRALDRFLEPFTKKKVFCGRDCTSCNYCESYIDKYLDHDKINNDGRQIVEKLRNTDGFRILIDKTAKR